MLTCFLGNKWIPPKPWPDLLESEPKRHSEIIPSRVNRPTFILNRNILLPWLKVLGFQVLHLLASHCRTHSLTLRLIITELPRKIKQGEISSYYNYRPPSAKLYAIFNNIFFKIYYGGQNQHTNIHQSNKTNTSGAHRSSEIIFMNFLSTKVTNRKDVIGRSE